MYTVEPIGAGEDGMVAFTLMLDGDTNPFTVDGMVIIGVLDGMEITGAPDGMETTGALDGTVAVITGTNHIIIVAIMVDVLMLTTTEETAFKQIVLKVEEATLLTTLEET
jgi:hypothetical protein